MPNRGDLDLPLAWDSYFLSIAKAVALKSKDPSTQVGAVLVNDDRLVIATGFNGLARSLYDDTVLLANSREKLKWVCHAEQNAVINAARVGVSLLKSTLYVTRFPCFSCCNVIVQAGVRRVYTEDKQYWDHDPLDPLHEGKRYVLQQSGLCVDAPNHPDFASTRPPALTPDSNSKK
ncbi:MAG: dCMP deaminase [Pseudomonadota bacterium]|jgi:dCMP deaminase